MKRIICFILALLLPILSVGCGDKQSNEDGGEGATLWPSYLTPASMAGDWSGGLPEGFTLRVGSFNVSAGGNVGGDISALAEEILALDLDIVGIQEVDEGTERSDGVYMTKALADACGFRYYKHTAALDYEGGTYGTAIISKYRIVDYSEIHLSTYSSQEPRAIGHARIEIKGFTIDFYNTHLSFESVYTRSRQLNDLKYAIFSGSNSILVGDFNVVSAAELALFADEYDIVNNGSMVTFPENGRPVDDIILERSWETVDCGAQDVAGKSDHNLLWAEIAYVGDAVWHNPAPEQ